MDIGDYRAAIEQTRRELREREAGVDIESLRARALQAPPVHSLSEALAQDQLALIVEPKRSIASRREAKGDLDIAQLARECENAGASALCVVTEDIFSDGSIDDVIAARSVCQLPLLARDFIVHPIQVYELRAAGADALFIPMLAFADADEDDDEPALGKLMGIAHGLHMDVVLSVQSEEELERALDFDPDIINIDNRDESERIDVERTFDLLAEVPAGKSVISESVANADEVRKLHRAGVDALLLDEGHVEGDLRAALAVFADLAMHDHDGR